MRWMDNIRKDMLEMGLKTEDAQNREFSRKYRYPDPASKLEQGEDDDDDSNPGPLKANSRPNRPKSALTT